MDFGSPEFVLAVIALSSGGWLVNNWIRARHGYALEDEWGGKTARASDDQSLALADENRELRGQLSSVGERVKVLERIVTDKSYDVATQIEALRDVRHAQASAHSTEAELRA